MTTDDTSPPKVNIRGLVIGDDFIRAITFHNVDLSDYTFAFRVDAGDEILDFTVNGPNYDGTDTTFSIQLPRSITETLTPNTRYLWQASWTDPDDNDLTMWRGWISTIARVEATP